MRSFCAAFLPQAAFPLPEVQRGINAFALGCRARFSACTVKVMWTGTWHSVKVEGAGAHYFWNNEGCDIITQHSDTTEPQLVYKAYGGSGIGYNSDVSLLLTLAYLVVVLTLGCLLSHSTYLLTYLVLIRCVRWWGIAFSAHQCSSGGLCTLNL